MNSKFNGKQPASSKQGMIIYRRHKKQHGIFDQMSLTRASLHREGKSLLMIFIILVADLYAGGDWQASGSFEPGQYEAIRAAIDDAFDQGLTGKQFACNISTALNNQFDRFWNVVSGKLRNLQYDAVLFGYAYIGHWFWINNYRDNKFVIVWKDYNCGTEFSESWGDAIAFYPENYSDLVLYQNNQVAQKFEEKIGTGDIWGALYSTIRDLENNQGVSNTVTGVGAFGAFLELQVCICHLAGGEWLNELVGTDPMSQWFVFETRAGKTPLAPLS